MIAVQQIVVKVPESSHGVSTESILVFIGGVLAATAAVAAAIITTRGASTRLQHQLLNERNRFEKQLAAEAERFESQIAHERHLAQRVEASASVEQIARLISRNVGQIVAFVNTVARDKEPKSGEVARIREQLGDIQEEISVVAIRLGPQSPVVDKMSKLVDAIGAVVTLCGSRESPLSNDQTHEIPSHVKEIRLAESQFLVAAKEALDGY